MDDKVIFTHELATHTLFHCEVSDAAQGEGVPLTYGHYRAHMKHATAAAFQAFKKAHAAQGMQGAERSECSVADGKVRCAAVPCAAEIVTPKR